MELKAWVLFLIFLNESFKFLYLHAQCGSYQKSTLLSLFFFLEGFANTEGEARPTGVYFLNTADYNETFIVCYLCKLGKACKISTNKEDFVPTYGVICHKKED